MARGDAPDGAAAQRDAPWRDETALQVDLTQTYHRARVDWWALIWLESGSDPATRTLGILLFLLVLGGTAAGAWMWIRLHRDMTAP